MAAGSTAERDTESYENQMQYLIRAGVVAPPVPVDIPLDVDLAQIYAKVAGQDYFLRPTDILLIQVLRNTAAKPTPPAPVSVTIKAPANEQPSVTVIPAS